MGLSGSGKSTLLRCISRLTDATGGKIFIEGEDLLAMNNKQLIELRKVKWEWFSKFCTITAQNCFRKYCLSYKLKVAKLKIVLTKLWKWLS